MLIDSKITFDPIPHKYYTPNGVELISVTTLLSLYKTPFDPSGKILEKCAAKRGISKEELKAEWEKAKIDGCNRGTSIHKSIESFILTKKISQDENKDIVKDFKKIKYTGALHSETLIGCEEIGVAGTVDLLEEYSYGNLNISDFKSNKKLSTYCPFGNRLLYPVDRLYQTDINIYSLQLSLYSYILEKKFGYWVNKLTVLWINPKTRKIEIIPIPNLRREVKEILNHYHKNYKGQKVSDLIK